MLTKESLRDGLRHYWGNEFNNVDLGKESAEMQLAAVASSTLSNYVRFTNLWIAFAGKK